MTLYRCARCERDLDATAFRPNPKMARGLHSWCIECVVANTRAWRAKHNGRYRARNRQRYADNLDVERARYRARHPAVTARCRTCLGTFTTTRPSKQRYCSAQHRASFARIGLGSARRLRVLVRDGWHCYLCDRDIDATLRWPHDRAGTVDHVKPVSAGGTNADSNLRAAHWSCNRDKGDTLIEWWVAA